MSKLWISLGLKIFRSTHLNKICNRGKVIFKSLMSNPFICIISLSWLFVAAHLATDMRLVLSSQLGLSKNLNKHISPKYLRTDFFLLRYRLLHYPLDTCYITTFKDVSSFQQCFRNPSPDQSRTHIPAKLCIFTLHRVKIGSLSYLKVPCYTVFHQFHTAVRGPTTLFEMYCHEPIRGPEFKLSKGPSTRTKTIIFASVFLSIISRIFASIRIHWKRPKTL